MPVVTDTPRSGGNITYPKLQRIRHKLIVAHVGHTIQQATYDGKLSWKDDAGTIPRNSMKVYGHVMPGSTGFIGKADDIKPWAPEVADDEFIRASFEFSGYPWTKWIDSAKKLPAAFGVPEGALSTIDIVKFEIVSHSTAIKGSDERRVFTTDEEAEEWLISEIKAGRKDSKYGTDLDIAIKRMTQAQMERWDDAGMAWYRQATTENGGTKEAPKFFAGGTGGGEGAGSDTPSQEDPW
jgi:hypothetical protein